MSVLLSAITGVSAAPGWREGAALKRDGARLTCDGRPFAAVGVNKHELLEQYLAKYLGRSDAEAAAARVAAKASLQRLSDVGVNVIRFRACPFWPTWATRTLLSKDPQVRTASWSAFDEMLGDCDHYDIRVIPSLAWNLAVFPDLAHESLTDFLTDQSSGGRVMFRQWVQDLVGRYAGRDTILFWELGNEWNLCADLRPMFAAKGVLEGIDPPGAQELLGGPVIRDGRNNFTAAELAALTRDLCRLIKSVDRNHLVGTGFSSPRSASWHLWLGSLRRATEMDWTEDTPEQQADYLRLLTPREVDLISLHFYGESRGTPSLEGLLNLKRAADGLATPVYVGEAGLPPDVFGEPVYDKPEAVESLRLLFRALREMGIPLTLAWTWDEWGQPIHEPVLRPTTQPRAVEVLQEAHVAAQQSAEAPSLDWDTLAARLRDLAAQLKALRPAGK